MDTAPLAMFCAPERDIITVNFLPSYMQLPRGEGNPSAHFLSIWDDHKITSFHPWAIRALKGYAALVFIQRKVKLWLARKRTFSLYPLLPLGSSVLRNILSYLSPHFVYPHPTLLVTEKQGALHVIRQVRVLPSGTYSKRLPIYRYHFVDTYMINHEFRRVYNRIISIFVIPLPSSDC